MVFSIFSGGAGVDDRIETKGCQIGSEVRVIAIPRFYQPMPKGESR